MELEVRNNLPTVKELESYFTEFESQASEWMAKAKEINVTDETQTDLMGEARKARLALRDIRLAVAGKHKELKEDALRMSQVLDSIKRRLTGMIEPIEAVLEEQEKFAITQDNKRKAELKSKRSKLLSEYMPFQDANVIPLEAMSEEAFSNMIETYRLGKLAKEEQDRKQAQDRLEEENRIRVENEKLRKENEKKDAQLQKERAEKKRLQDEAEAKRVKEEAKKKDEAAAKRKAARAPDKEKLLAFSESIGELKCAELKDEDAMRILRNALNLLNKVTIYINDNAKHL